MQAFLLVMHTPCIGDRARETDGSGSTQCTPCAWVGEESESSVVAKGRAEALH